MISLISEPASQMYTCDLCKASFHDIKAVEQSTYPREYINCRLGARFVLALDFGGIDLNICELHNDRDIMKVINRVVPYLAHVLERQYRAKEDRANVRHPTSTDAAAHPTS